MLTGIKRRIVSFAINRLYQGTDDRYWKKKAKLLRLLGHEIGEGTKIVGPITLYGHLKVGNNCWVGADFIVHGLGNVTIGNSCDIGPEVRFLTGSHKIGDQSRRAGEGISHSIVIEDGCWIGARSSFVGDITVHRASVIGACSLVNKDIRSNVIAAGIPAKELKQLEL
ncbi:MAG TPA: acyltransferase [Mobilitalea sp.]|nr:acyltransferase [Mobilitalea sp.]